MSRDDELWLRSHPDQWVGWPADQLFEGARDRERLKKLRLARPWSFRGMTDGEVFAEVSRAVARIRLEHRRRYARATEDVAWDNVVGKWVYY